MGELIQIDERSLGSDLLRVLSEERLLDQRASYVIQAGYFQTAPDPFSQQSLLRGLALKKGLEAYTSKATPIFSLHNDIGKSCEDTCISSRDGQEEKPLEWQVPVIREKTAFNRGLRLLRKELKRNPSRLVIEKGDADTRIGLRTTDGTVINLAIQRGESLVPLCPLILASFYEMLVREAGSESIIIDYCHYTEVQRVGFAVQVLNQLFLTPEQRPRAVVAAALDHHGDNLNPILF